MTELGQHVQGTASGDRAGEPARLPEPRRTERHEPGRIDDLERRVSRLEQLAWGNLPDGASVDVVDPELTRLAELAERGQALTRLLAGPEVRAACEQAVATWDEWHRRHRELLEIALSASRTIAITSPEQRSRAHAVQAFQAARFELAELASWRQGYLNAATYAKRQLDQDRDVRDRCQDEIDAGHQAWTLLITRLRVRTAAAVDRAEPLPTWLVTGLGPPAVGAMAAWREAATDLLAYRITYAVSDPVEPLGPIPTADDSPRRRRWHANLGRQLASWQDTG